MEKNLTPCEFVYLSDKCFRCQKCVKKGFLTEDGHFVCSETCAEKLENRDDIRPT